MAAPRLAGLLALGLAACGEWPRHAHLPDPGDLLPPNTSPRALVAVDWSSLGTEGTDQPPGAPLGELNTGSSVGSGVLVASSLDGSGWDGAAEPVELVGDACGSSGTRAPFRGDYAGEVEVFSFSLAAPAVVCVRAIAGDDTVSFDAVLHRLDACDIPVEPVVEPEDGGGNLGFNALGPIVDYATPELPAGRYSLVYAAYLPDDSTVRPYQIGLSAWAAGDLTLCPLLPEELDNLEAPELGRVGGQP